jgi:hypothetical protein
MSTYIKFSDLVDAYDWVSAGAPFENAAYLDKVTGAVYLSSELVDVDSELPEDYEDESKYISVPHKFDLDLGKSLALQFIEEMLPDKSDQAHAFFRKRGAYSRFKDLLEREGLLDDWYKYEEEAIKSALYEWAEENDLEVGSGKAG